MEKQGQEIFLPVIKILDKAQQAKVLMKFHLEWIFPRLDIRCRSIGEAAPRSLKHSERKGRLGSSGRRSRLGVNYAAAAAKFRIRPQHHRYETIIYRAPDPHSPRLEGAGGAMICAAGLFVGFVSREANCWLPLAEWERKSTKPISVKSVSAQLPAESSGKKIRCHFFVLWSCAPVDYKSQIFRRQLIRSESLLQKHTRALFQLKRASQIL